MFSCTICLFHQAPLGKTAGAHGSSRGLSRPQAQGLKKPSGPSTNNSSALTARNLQRASPVVDTDRARHGRTHSNSSNSSVSSTASNRSFSQLMNPMGSKTGLPVTKMQLMQPGKLQKNPFAFNRSKLAQGAAVKKASGPMKAAVPSLSDMGEFSNKFSHK